MLCTSGFVNDVMGPVGMNEAQRYVTRKFVRWRYQLDLKTIAVFGRVCQNAAPGVKSALCV